MPPPSGAGAASSNASSNASGKTVGKASLDGLRLGWDHSSTFFLRGAIAEVLQQTHVAFEVESPRELSAEAIAARLLAAGGTHRPNAFDFGGGQLLREHQWQ